MSSLVAVETFLLCDHCFWDHRGLILRGGVGGAGVGYGSGGPGADLVDGKVLVMKAVGCSCRNPRGRRLGGNYLVGKHRF